MCMSPGAPYYSYVDMLQTCAKVQRSDKYRIVRGFWRDFALKNIDTGRIVSGWHGSIGSLTTEIDLIKYCEKDINDSTKEDVLVELPKYEDINTSKSVS